LAKEFPFRWARNRVKTGEISWDSGAKDG